MANLKKNLLYNFGQSVSQVLIPLVSIPYVARILDPEGIGRVSFIDSFTYYMLVIAEVGLGVYGTRMVARMRQNGRQLQTTVAELLVLHLCATGIVLFFYIVAVACYWQQLHDWRLIAFSFSFLLTHAFACEWYFRGTEEFRYIAVRSLVTRLLGLASIFVLIKGPADYYIYYGIIAGSAILNAVFNFYRLSRIVPLRFSQLNWRQHIAGAKFIYYISLTYSITLLLDNVLLRMVSTAAAVGLYAFSARIVRLSTALLTDSLVVFFPRIVAVEATEAPGQSDSYLQRNFALLAFLAIPLSAGILLLAPDIVYVMFGPQFQPAVTSLQLLALFPCIKAFNLFLGNQVLMAHNHEKAYLFNLLVSGGLFILCTLLLSYHWADQGASIALILAESATAVLNLLSVKRLMPAVLKVIDYRTIWQAAVASLLFLPLLTGARWLTLPALPQLAVGIGACVACYALVQVYVLRTEVALLMKSWVTRKPVLR